MASRKPAYGRIFLALLGILVSAPFPYASASGLSPAAPTSFAQPAKVIKITNFDLSLPNAYIVYEPSKKALQIAALGKVLSYGDGWESVQVKPYVFHLRHRAWKKHFWKVNTSRKEVYLVWGGVFGRITTTPGAAPAREVEGDREDMTVDVVGGAGDRAPDRFFIRFAAADLFFDPVARDLRLAAGGATLSPCDDWEVRPLKDFLFHIRLKTWQGFFLKVNTSRLTAWWTTGGVFGELGGQDKEADLTMKSFQRPYSMARLRTALDAPEQARLRAISQMMEATRPIAQVDKAAADFVRESPGVDVEAAASELERMIKRGDAKAEEVKEARKAMEQLSENADQKVKNLLSAMMIIMRKTQTEIVRSIR